MKTYSEMAQYTSFKERVEYLYIGNTVAENTFGFDRWLNQDLYRCKEWKQLRNHIILRDNGCDLGCKDRPIFMDKYGRGIYVHHIEPLTKKDLLEHSNKIFDENNLVCVSFNTHQFIHYGKNVHEYGDVLVERRPNDTCPWKKG